MKSQMQLKGMERGTQSRNKLCVRRNSPSLRREERAADRYCQIRGVGREEGPEMEIFTPECPLSLSSWKPACLPSEGVRDSSF